MVIFDTDKVDGAVLDNDRYFVQHTISKLDHDVDRLLSHTDKCTYVDARRFKDRFGYDLPWEFLSTGGKTVLNAYYNPDVIFDCLECGKSALIDATHLPHGQFSNGVPYSDSDDDPIDVMVDDEHYTSVREVKDAYC
ncbi:hypothetical protein [Brotaphodocola sp.]|uniref:hypothetical protein n=1 Tax=Brotaphodocola sp. TaxID=3073577 RepID=UPI003D7C6B69